METIAVLLMLLAMVGGIISIVGIIKGSIKFFKIETRKNAGLALLGFFVLFIISGIMMPPPDETTEVATSNGNEIVESIESDEFEKIEESNGESESNENEGKVEEEVAENKRDSEENTSNTTEETTKETKEQDKPSTSTPPATPSEPKGNLIVHYIDVGQGDATLLQGPDFTVLIDAGRHNRNDVIPYLKSVGVSTIDLVVGTHPHADHIGQIDKVINEFEVSEVWMSGTPHTTQTFERVLDAIEKSGASYHEPRSGEKFQVGALEIEVFNPIRITGQFHEDSIVMRTTFGEIGFIFSGDAEARTEREVIRRHNDVKAQILKLGHHGSTTSSIPEFLQAVSPEVAIYSAGAGNSYGHPHKPIVDRINQMNIEIYGTDVHGTIKITTDGKTYSITTAKSGQVSVEDGSEPTPTPTPEPTTPSPSGSININTASFEELQEIIHIGDSRAKAIIDGRPWTSLSQLTRISGISDNRLNDIREEGKAYVE